jgi:hypothetical protein
MVPIRSGALLDRTPFKGEVEGGEGVRGGHRLLPTFSASYSSTYSVLSSSGRSLHIWPMILPISQSLSSGFCALTVSHTLRLYRMYGINGFSGGLGGLGARGSTCGHGQKKRKYTHTCTTAHIHKATEMIER